MIDSTVSKYVRRKVARTASIALTDLLLTTYYLLLTTYYLLLTTYYLLEGLERLEELTALAASGNKI